jgi:beta-glucanase (GH16 family)
MRRIRRRLRDAAGAFLAAVAVASVSPAWSAASDPPLKTAPDGRALTLVFSDDFQTFRPWTGKSGVWRTVFGDGSHQDLDHRTIASNGELQVYVDPNMVDANGSLGLDPFSVNGGVLAITAAPTPAAIRPRIKNYAYTSGLITSQPSFSQIYGYFEMRAELPPGRGLWPAFWLLPTDQSWPPEIDVVESFGDPTEIFVTAHSTVEKPKGGKTQIAGNAFHVFAVSWDQRQLIWYIDGREIDKETTPADMRKPMYMLANLAIIGREPGAPDATTHFPAALKIDYIRAYRFTP